MKQFFVAQISIENMDFGYFPSKKHTQDLVGKVSTNIIFG